MRAALLLVTIALASLPLAAATPAEITDDHLASETLARLARGTNCDCPCLFEAKALFDARKVLCAFPQAKEPAIKKLGESINADLERNHCLLGDSRSGGSGGLGTGGGRYATTSNTLASHSGGKGGGGWIGGGGKDHMTLPDFVLAVATLDAAAQKKLVKALPASYKNKYDQWEERHPTIAKKLLTTEDITKATLLAGVVVPELAAEREQKRYDLGEIIQRETVGPVEVSRWTAGFDDDELPLFATAAGTGILGDEVPPLLHAIGALAPGEQETFLSALPSSVRTAYASWIGAHSTLVDRVLDKRVLDTTRTWKPPAWDEFRVTLTPPH